MEKAERYIDGFLKTTGMNRRYDMNAGELLAFSQAARKGDTCNVVCAVFDYGYAKGYRACQAKMKKKSREG